MADLRNKLAKDAARARQEAWLAKHRPLTPPEPPIACQCGHTIYETTIWAHSEGWRQPGRYYCAVCLPPELGPPPAGAV